MATKWARIGARRNARAAKRLGAGMAPVSHAAELESSPKTFVNYFILLIGMPLLAEMLDEVFIATIPINWTNLGFPNEDPEEIPPLGSHNSVATQSHWATLPDGGVTKTWAPNQPI